MSCGHRGRNFALRPVDVDEKSSVAAIMLQQCTTTEEAGGEACLLCFSIQSAGRLLGLTRDDSHGVLRRLDPLLSHWQNCHWQVAGAAAAPSDKAERGREGHVASFPPLIGRQTADGRLEVNRAIHLCLSECSGFEPIYPENHDTIIVTTAVLAVFPKLQHTVSTSRIIPRFFTWF